MKIRVVDMVVARRNRKFSYVRNLLLSVFILLGGYAEVSANNIRITGRPRVVGFAGSDTAIVELNLSWDNSWRDDFNWDAAWIFLKYKKRGVDQAWHHGYLLREGHEATPQGDNQGGGYTFMFGEAGSGANARVTGVYLMRDLISEGRVNARLRLKWLINANPQNRLTLSDFGSDYKSVYVAVHAIEMVYVPYGAYYVGDLSSYGSLQNKAVGAPLPEMYDIIDNNSGYEYSIKNTVATGAVENIADHNAAAAYPNSTLYFNAVGGGWVQVDFKTPKTIRYFGVSAASNYCSGTQDCRPSGNWYLTGSNDSLMWDRLYTGVNTDWKGTSVAYPVQNTLKVTNPGSYRYYRIEMSGAVRTDDGIVIQSIAMTEQNLEAAMIDREDALTLFASGTAWTGTLGANYPKGYAGFYVMKYETSQEQYVEFLNALTLTQQKAHVDNNDFEQMKRGEYVFGDRDRPNCRNGIAFVEQKGEGGPAVFGNNLNPANDFFALDDGQTLACNYLSPYDMLAYCDWSGLRPMSELEYEKACRRPYPQLPEKGEYAWNANSGVNSLNGLGDLAFLGDEREMANNIAKNVNGGTNNRMLGPVRCGLFATSGTNQPQSGATYWGVMEMSGNLWEMCYNVTANGAKFIANNFDYSHGNGELNAAGATDIAVSYWPAVVGAIGVRGGGFKSVDSLLRTSDRSFADGNYFTAMTQRDSTVGFRGARGMLNTTGFDGGAIACPNGTSVDTVCADMEVTLRGVLPNNSIGKLSYVWYVSENNGASWKLIEGESGANLRYLFVNTTTTFKLCKFKRKVTCAVGEAETQASVYVAPLPWTDSLDTYTNVYPSFTVISTWGAMPQTRWKLDYAPSEIAISDKGLVSGLTANSVFWADVTVASDKCPGIDYNKRIVVRRDFSAVGTGSIELAPGNYVMECWGAQGGRGRVNWSLSGYGGAGAYTKGTISLSNSQMFYTYVGGKGNDSGANGKCTGAAGGWNGGAAGGKDGNCDSQPEPGGGGGGASDIRLIYGSWSEITSLRSRIMVAAGGGGSSWSYPGEVGGALSTSGAHQAGGYAFGYGGAGTNSAKLNVGPGGGGGGYYGGYGGASSSARGYGGSSFISGHAGCNAVDASGVHTGQPVHYSGLQFNDTYMQAGARGGNGYVRISPVLP